MMHELNHMLCIMKQIIEPPIACLSINIDLETNCRSDISQNVLIPHGHVSQCLFTFLVMVPFVHANLAIS